MTRTIMNSNRFILTLVAWCIIEELSYGHECGSYLEHMVSGPNGVPDTSISASSTHYNSGNHRHGPKYGRLNLFITAPIRAEGWVTDARNGNQFIQVAFTRPVVICAVLTQGRNGNNQWTKSYAVLYSTDGTLWQNVKNSEHNIVFTGNRDLMTIVRNNFEKCVEATFMRINPRSFNYKIAMRMDFLGCSKKRRDLILMKSGKRPFKMWKRTQSNTEISDPISSHWAPDLGSCAIACYKSSLCENYSFNQDNSCVLLQGGNDTKAVNDAPKLFIYSSAAGFLSHDANAYDYTKKYTAFQDKNVYYKIITEKKTKSEASQICAGDDARLLILKSSEIMVSLKDDKEISFILKKESEYFINGEYKDGKWAFDNDEEVPNALWASSFPQDNAGNCIVWTPTGLKTQFCNSKLYFVCEMWLKHS